MNATIVLLCMLLSMECAGQETIPLEEHRLIGTDGKAYAGEWGRIRVTEDRESTQTPDLSLPFFRIKTEHSDPLPPLFILEGGPGDSPSILERLDELIPLLHSFAERSDVIVVAQRGNGGSIPNLSCQGTFAMPLDRPLTEKRFTKAYRGYIQKCVRHWQDQGRVLSGYQVLAMADDIECVRQALGYEKIILFGGSFGSHHALAYLQRYPDRVERLLLDSAEGLSHTVKLPLDADRMLQQLSDRVARDSTLSIRLPSFTGLVKNTLQMLSAKPLHTKIVHPETGKEVTMVLGAYDLQLATTLELGRMGYRDLPYHYLRMQENDFSWLAAYALRIRLGQSRNLMAVLTDCASGASKDRWEQVEHQAKETILGNALNNINFEACDLLPYTRVQRTLARGLKSAVPLLIVIGDQDARTPLSNSREILQQFENGRLLVVKHGSHDLFQEGFERLAPILIAYLTSDNPTEFKLPPDMEVPLQLRLD